MSIKNFFLLGTLMLSLNACYYDNQEDLFQYVQAVECNTVTANYTADLVPILVQHCFRCHRNGRTDGNVNLEGYNNVKTYADDGSLLGTTDHQAGFPIMPTSGIKIPACEIEVMRVWINEGALNN